VTIAALEMSNLSDNTGVAFPTQGHIVGIVQLLLGCNIPHKPRKLKCVSSPWLATIVKLALAKIELMLLIYLCLAFSSS
jgi:hypothetical protein